MITDLPSQADTMLPLDTDVRTVLPSYDPTDSVPQARRRLGGVTATGTFNVLGSLACGLSVAILLFGIIAPFSGLLGEVAVGYFVFLGTYGVLVSQGDARPTVVDKLITVLLYSAATIMFVALLFVILFTIFRGSTALVHWNFYTQDLSRTSPLAPVTVGGIKHALIGTLWTITIALVITVPLGLAGAVFINEVGGRVAKLVRIVVDAMTALPSIVAGLFIYAAWILTLHFEKSGLAASFAMSIMMLPIILRASDVVLRLVPGNLREASAAMGAPQWRTVLHVVLPTARSGLTTSVILGMARGIGETAPVLLTAGYTLATNTNPLHGPMVSLPLVAFELISSGEPHLITRGFGAASFLLLVVLALMTIARLIGGRGPGTLSKRQARRIERGSTRDLARFDSKNSSLIGSGGTPE